MRFKSMWKKSKRRLAVPTNSMMCSSRIQRSLHGCSTEIRKCRVLKDSYSFKKLIKSFKMPRCKDQEKDHILEMLRLTNLLTI
jgi:formiminotetrahydrofolate cyclodeaminase